MSKLPSLQIKIQNESTRLHIIFLALSLALFLAALDTVLITTALPTISREFQVPDAGFAWVGSVYLLANAATVPFWGKVSDIFGRKPILLVANAVFLLGSIISGASNGIGMLIAGRAIQGMGGGGVVVLVNVCVSDLWSVRDRGLYLGIVGAIWAVASALGPVFGGIFAERVNWRWCFWINLPIDGVAIILLLLFLDVHNPHTPLIQGLLSIDYAGTFTVATATVCVMLGLQFGGVTYPWSSVPVILLLVFGILTFGLFIFTQWKISPSPTIPLRIFSNRSNFSALGVCFFDAIVFNSVAYFLPLYFQLVLRQGPLASGLLMLSLAIPLSVISAASGFLMQRTGRYLELLRSGMALMTLGVGLFISFPGHFDWAKVIVFLIVVGIGFGPNFHAPLIALHSRLEERDIAAGTSTFGFVRMLAGAMGIVLGQVLFAGQMGRRAITLLMSEVGLNPLVVSDLTKGSAITQIEAIKKLERPQQDFVAKQLAGSMSMMWVLYCVFSAVGLIISFGIGKYTMQKEKDTIRLGEGSSAETVGKTEGNDEESR
ncbi:MFS general substrate transporter [Eremomyces bilateralis CBS 781.70]|uniref:MFS general substrate transporter n=1 Tax=Eremomyces bilateralis CBS 781.70 TaxID=1392243 RepID=A0A6G1GA38_9PEZI|nr:MFS general substrate transporter [Eremomyces bilateralis CBS 781.70]KAF1814947.1 MFS general substrate transporter [Eremomyces bilateralis CBS 781.70]